MVNETLARRYATAIFGLASDANKVQSVGHDLREVARAIAGDASTATFFVSPIVDRGDKERALLGAFDGRIDEIALHSLLLLVRKRREKILDAIVTEYQKLELTARGAEPLQITTARTLPESEMRAMIARLERAYGKTFEVSVRVDPSLIGGVRMTMGDRRIDGSIEGRLEEMTRSLFAGSH